MPTKYQLMLQRHIKILKAIGRGSIITISELDKRIQKFFKLKP